MNASIFCLLPLVLASAAASAAAQPTAPANSDAIVVTAQRSGIPVWRVRNGDSTVILVGTIEEVAKGTDWNPESLAAALRQADQVMFPQDVQYTGGFLAVMGAPGKVRKMERLPAGQTLANILGADQYRRLLALQENGMLRQGFETRRPLFVAYDLMQAAKGERPGGFLSISRVDWKTDPKGFVRNAIHKYRLRLVPMRKEGLNAALDRIARTPPSAQAPCLMAAAKAAEAGPAAFQARSRAWVARRVPEVVNSPAEQAFATCASVIRSGDGPQEIEASLLQALHQPVTTIAVIELSTLAAPGAILDRLAAAGFDISGPKWR